MRARAGFYAGALLAVVVCAASVRAETVGETRERNVIDVLLRTVSARLSNWLVTGQRPIDVSSGESIRREALDFALTVGGGGMLAAHSDRSLLNGNYNLADIENLEAVSMIDNYGRREHPLGSLAFADIGIASASVATPFSRQNKPGRILFDFNIAPARGLFEAMSAADEIAWEGASLVFYKHSGPLDRLDGDGFIPAGVTYSGMYPVFGPGFGADPIVGAHERNHRNFGRLTYAAEAHYPLNDFIGVSKDDSFFQVRGVRTGLLGYGYLLLEHQKPYHERRSEEIAWYLTTGQYPPVQIGN